MTQTNCTYLLVALISVSKPAIADDVELSACLSSYSCRDKAVSSLLLAAGMYGGLNNKSGAADKGKLSLTQSKNMFNGVLSEQGQFNGQDITFSYKGSSGRLGFSAGYIYTAPQETQEAGTILLGLDMLTQNLPAQHGITENPWYVTLNLSKSFQFTDNIAFEIGSKTMLFSPSPDDDEREGGRDNRSLSMSLNLPVSYKGVLTVTPEIQWSRALLNDDTQMIASTTPDLHAHSDNVDTFYGGMSISFSY
ncbi:MAG: hypothetical protein D3923_08560 [Candidatus Electrothrix sp. AR3]|nr:hypothetical protein [Candidatus Electrothrix sp. AR3]